MTISAGPMHSSRHMDFSPYMKPMCRRANPDEETTNWRAVCGRTACTVRRAGRVRAFPDPYSQQAPCCDASWRVSDRLDVLRTANAGATPRH